jgi:predicted membrane protein
MNGIHIKPKAFVKKLKRDMIISTVMLILTVAFFLSSVLGNKKESCQHKQIFWMMLYMILYILKFIFQVVTFC